MNNPWRIPLSLIICSSIIFTAVTFAFGFRINRMTGDFEITNEMMGDDSWSYDPMEIVWGSHWKYYAMAGFYVNMAIFTWLFFDYLKRHETI